MYKSKKFVDKETWIEDPKGKGAFYRGADKTAQDSFNEWSQEMGDKIEIIGVSISPDGKTISVVYSER